MLEPHGEWGLRNGTQTRESKRSQRRLSRYVNFDIYYSQLEEYKLEQKNANARFEPFCKLFSLHVYKKVTLNLSEVIFRKFHTPLYVAMAFLCFENCFASDSHRNKIGMNEKSALNFVVYMLCEKWKI